MTPRLGINAPDLSVLEGLFALLATVCDCDEAWTARGRHAVDCRWQFIHDFLSDEDIAVLRDTLQNTESGLDPERLARAIRDGFTHPDRPLDDGFEIYGSAHYIAGEIIAQLQSRDPGMEEPRGSTTSERR